MLGIAKGMGHAAVRNARHIIHLFQGRIVLICVGDAGAVSIAGIFHIFSLIDGSRITEIGPKEGTDPHFLLFFRDGFIAGVCDFDDFPCAQLRFIFIAQIHKGKGFGSDAIAVGFFSDDQRRTAPEIPGGIQGLWRQYQHGQRALYAFLSIADAGYQILSGGNQGRHKLGVVDLAPAHGHELGILMLDQLLNQLGFIVDDPHRADGKMTLPAVNRQRLGFRIADAADTHVSFHGVRFLFKFCPEGGILYAVNGPVKARWSVNAHTSCFRSQVGMVVRSEKQIHHTIVF